MLAPEPYLGVGRARRRPGRRRRHRRAEAEVARRRWPPARACWRSPHAEPGGRWTADARGVTAPGDGDAWTLTGVKEPVPHGARADVLVVSAALPDGRHRAVPRGRRRRGATRHRLPASRRRPRRPRRVRRRRAATPLGEPGRDLTAEHRDGAATSPASWRANQALGAMEVALRATTDYLKSRKQFGVTLNTFQALTFRAADMYVSLELAQQRRRLGDDGRRRPATAEALADAAARAGLQVSRGRAPHRPGGDPAARRHRDDRGVRRRQPGRPPHRARPPARRRPPPPRPRWPAASPTTGCSTRSTRPCRVVAAQVAASTSNATRWSRNSRSPTCSKPRAAWKAATPRWAGRC